MALYALIRQALEAVFPVFPVFSGFPERQPEKQVLEMSSFSGISGFPVEKQWGREFSQPKAGREAAGEQGGAGVARARSLIFLPEIPEIPEKSYLSRTYFSGCSLAKPEIPEKPARSSTY